MDIKEINTSVLPKSFLEILPTTCNGCGTALQITETLSKVYCPNPFCIDSGAYRLGKLLKELVDETLSPAACKQFLQSHKTTNPYDIFGYNPQHSRLYAQCTKEEAFKISTKLRKFRTIPLWRFVHIGFLPNVVPEDVMTLFKEYTDLDMFYRDLEKKGLEFIQAKLNIDAENDNLAIKAIKVYEDLKTYKTELFQGSKYITFKNNTKSVVVYSVSKSPGQGFETIPAFIQHLNTKYAKKIELIYQTAITSDCRFLVWDKENTPTSKILQVEHDNFEVIIDTLIAAFIDNEDLVVYGVPESVTQKIHTVDDIEDYYDTYCDLLDNSKFGGRLIRIVTAKEFEEYLKTI